MKFSNYSVILIVVFLSPKSHSEIPCESIRNSQFEDASALLQEVALIGTDDRIERNPGDVVMDIEGAQGRIYCHAAGPVPGQGTIPTLEQLKSGYTISNATLAFRDDVAIVSRHLFVKRDGGRNRDPKNCFFEHIPSGRIIRITGAEYPAYSQDSKKMTYHHNDVAIVRLSESPEGATFIREEDIDFRTDLSQTWPLKVVSNYAENSRNGNSFALTMTNCQALATYKLESGRTSNVYATDCDTGQGSSGASAWVMRNGAPKWFGVVSGETTVAPEGGQFSKDLNTLVTTFDESLRDSYRRLMSTQSI